MEEYKTVLFDRMQNLVAERITTSDPITYAAKCDSLTFGGFSSARSEVPLVRTLASSSQRQEHLEAKMAYVADAQEVMASKQKEMDNQMKIVITKQDDMDADLK